MSCRVSSSAVSHWTQTRFGWSSTSGRSESVSLADIWDSSARTSLASGSSYLSPSLMNHLGLCSSLYIQFYLTYSIWWWVLSKVAGLTYDSTKQTIQLVVLNWTLVPNHIDINGFGSTNHLSCSRGRSVLRRRHSVWKVTSAEPELFSELVRLKPKMTFEIRCRSE